MPKSPIACRVASYAPFEQLAYEHLASLGVRHVEIPVPAPNELASIAKTLTRYGLTATSLHGQCDAQRPDIADQVKSQMPALQALGTKFLFVSAKAEHTPLPTAYDRLRAAGDVAHAHDVTIVLETHPDLVTNAVVTEATMDGVHHPNVRINFDTANVYFYNHHIDAVTELRPIISHVASLHLKETDGGFRSWHFPALGTGVVRFAELFELLDAAGFAGPCTLEIEGVEGEQRTAQLVCQRVTDSIAFLRQLGRL
jgi:L-ribulose-5-phosphate 3-epimerase